MVAIDPLIHPPARLQLMTTLTAVTEAEFVTLREALGVSDSVLSKHVSALADARATFPAARASSRVAAPRGWR